MSSPSPSDLRLRVAIQRGFLKLQVSHFNEVKSLQTKKKAVLHTQNHECLIVYATVPRLSLFDSFVFCSYANPAGTFPPLCVCTALCTGCSRLPVFLNRASCQCRCSSEYVQHVLQAEQQLPKNWRGRSSAPTAATKLGNHRPR